MKRNLNAKAKKKNQLKIKSEEKIEKVLNLIIRKMKSKQY